MADAGLQAVLGLEGKGSLHPKMEKTLYSRWFRIEGVPKRVFFADFMDFSAGSTIKEGQKSRILLNGERRRIIPDLIDTCGIRRHYSGCPTCY